MCGIIFSSGDIISIVVAISSMVVAIFVSCQQNKTTRSTAMYQSRIEQFDKVRESLIEFASNIDLNFLVDVYNVAVNDGPIEARELVNKRYDALTRSNMNIELLMSEYRRKGGFVDAYLNERSGKTMAYSESLNMVQLMLTEMCENTKGYWNSEQLCGKLNTLVPQDVLEEIRGANYIDKAVFLCFLKKAIVEKSLELNLRYGEDGIAKSLLNQSSCFLSEFQKEIDRGYKKGLY